MGIETPSSLSDIDRRLRAIELKLGIVTEPTNTDVFTPTSARPAPAPAPPPTSSKSTGLYLGAIASICLLLASILMVRLAVDSGWLTPFRQVWITALFGFICVASAYFKFLPKDARYLSILPGVGIAILNMATYGAAFLHHLIEPATAFVMINCIALFSLFVYRTLREDLYILYGVACVHIGLIAFSPVLNEVGMICVLLLVWNGVFAFLAAQTGARKLLAICAYFGSATIYFIGGRNEALYGLLATAQGALFFLYLFATVTYSRTSRSVLSESETAALFPPLLVFYMTEYSWLSTLFGNLASYLFIGIAAILWLTYLSAARSLSRDGKALPSAKLIYLFVGAVVLHAFFFQLVGDRFKPLVGILIAGAVFLRRERLDFRGAHFGLGLLALTVGGAGFLMALLDVPNLSGEGIGAGGPAPIVNGIIYGTLLLAITLFPPITRGPIKNELRNIAILLAHLQWMTALYRLRSILGFEALSFSVTLLWITYAFAVFSIGWAKRMATLCQSCVFILGLCILKLLVYDVWNQGPTIRILSLAGLGIALFVFGYLLRRVSEWRPTRSEANATVFPKNQ